MRSIKFFSILAILIFGTVLVVASIALSYFTASITIKNSGRIATEKTSVTYNNELRGVHIADSIFAFPYDWEVIAETLKGYKINFVTILLMGLPTKEGLRQESDWRAALQAFHSRGIEVWISYHAVGEMAVNEAYKCVRSDGSLDDWNCPSNPNFRQEVKECVEFVARNYDIDGLMFDYIRYQYGDECYCQYCKAAFEQWLGESIPESNWPPNPSDFAPEGSRYNEFMEWRTIPLTNLVKDVRDWMLAINPNLKFGLAQWTLFGYSPDYSPTYQRYWIGQDTAYWVAQGYLDMTMPMIYNEPPTGEPHSVETDIKANQKYITGGPEGKIPLVAFIDTGSPGSPAEPREPAEVKACIDKARETGADGWILWCYGGPGVNDGGYHIDIRPYLDLLQPMPDVFTLRNIRVFVSGTQATVSWVTDLPTTSKVEYSTTPLFISTKKEWTEGMYYWDVDHVEGIIIENTTMVTTHSITITGLIADQKYYFRIQSQNENGTATTEVLTFTL